LSIVTKHPGYIPAFRWTIEVVYAQGRADIHSWQYLYFLIC